MSWEREMIRRIARPTGQPPAGLTLVQPAKLRGNLHCSGSSLCPKELLEGQVDCPVPHLIS